MPNDDDKFEEPMELTGKEVMALRYLIQTKFRDSRGALTVFETAEEGATFVEKLRRLTGS